MIRDGSLTMADIVWTLPDTHHQEHQQSDNQCLVTWEVYGGGIMGNLLTDTPEAQLSLWPDSKYHVQVTCKNKVCLFVFFFLLIHFSVTLYPDPGIDLFKRFFEQ